jgi:hypothetical protein
MAALKKAVFESLSSLNPRDRILLQLRYTKGVSQKNLARMLGWNEVKLSRHLTRLRRDILESIGKRSGLAEGEFEESLPDIRRSIKSLAEECFSGGEDFEVKFPEGGFLGKTEN